MSNANSQYVYTLTLLRPELLKEGPTEIEADVLAAHVEYLQARARDGEVLLAGRTQTDDTASFGLVILQASDDEQANNLMRNDPAVKHHVMQAELFPYRIAVLSEAINDACAAAD